MKQTPEQKKRNNLLYAFEHILSGRSVSGRKTAVDRQLMKDGYIVFDRTRKHEYPDMRQRCHNPSDRAYSDYGGRGIYVCEEWRNSLEAFIQDMGPRPSAAHQLDRIDNDGPYCKDNCRWATRSEQSNNRRNNHCVEVNGVSMTLAEWSRHTGISYGTIQRRREHGWADEAAVSTPVARRRANG